MVRFSCFHPHIHKEKKSVQLSAEEMHKTLEDHSSQSLKNSTYSAMNNPSLLKMEGDVLPNNSDHASDSSPIEKDWKFEEIDWKSNAESHVGINKISRMKKSQSMGSRLNWKGNVSGGDESEDETDQRFSCNGSLSQCEVKVPDSAKDFGINMPDHSQGALPSNSFQECSDVVNIGSIFSIGDPQQLEKEVHENSDVLLSGAGGSSYHTLRTPPSVVRSRSLPNIHSHVHHSTRSLRRSKSAEGLNVIDSRHKEMSTDEMGTQEIQHEERDDSALNNGKGNFENAADGSYHASDYAGSAKDWIIPPADNDYSKNAHQKGSSFYSWDELPSKDFRIRRIEEWVRDLQQNSPLEEDSPPSAPNDLDVPENDTVLDGSPVARGDGKVDPSMESVKRYISSLSATSTAAQLSNYGLVVIPFLSALTSLRALNLSGNAIVRINAGSLPRGLHVLNLSKNNISSIEGLRELTRLRVLDLSYNRILRIGHGLASCSSLKELYLAGNKISEVEGVHRLLKLNVLDLRFNKISTTKCLGQLAANYNSLQAISLEGNPAQKNIGDEQLTKYLQGLLPHLAYYNRQPIKAGKLKDVATDRSTRLGISSRAELKTIRKGTHGVAAHKNSSSSTHARRSQAVASSKASRSRNARLPPSGTKTSTDRHHFYDFSNKLLKSMTHLSIRRSRSEGTLGGFI